MWGPRVPRPPKTMTTLHILSFWNFDPTVLVGGAALLLAYVAAVGFRLTRRAIYFALGLLVIWLALLSPIDALADQYLFSAHMLQHLLLAAVAPPLLLLGIPNSLWEGISQRLPGPERILSRPVLAWLVGVGTLTVWHFPTLYNATLENDAIHVFEHLCFLISASIFWYPIVRGRLAAPTALIYLMGATHVMTLLGIVLAYFPHLLYPAYAQPTDSLGILKLIRSGWGISARDDQEIAGLMMAVPGGAAYLTAIFVLVVRWFAHEDEYAAETIKQ